ncbi:MAG: hypothetical protein BWY47_01056 [Bacteroidetes bacterium ADurb.Bin302]|nr:MAG: hypothetical protein BWY47_01056 [Bacteroidetes bacterium ADurb.Bin302]
MLARHRYRGANNTSDELKSILDSAVISKYDNSYLGNPVFKITSNETLPGEIFRPYLKNYKIAKSRMREYIEKGVLNNIDIEVSNLGRIRVNNSIKEQIQNDYGWLFVELLDEVKYEVYRLVGETWVQCPVTDTSVNIVGNNYWTIHHINNNGFDNRPHNLIWVTTKEHANIDPCPWNRSNLLIDTMLNKLGYYTKLKIINREVIEIIEDLCLLCTETNTELKSKISKLIQELEIIKDDYQFIKWNKIG